MATFELNEETIKEIVVIEIKQALLTELDIGDSQNAVQGYVWVLQNYMIYDEYDSFIKEVIKLYPDVMKRIDTAESIGDDDGKR